MPYHEVIDTIAATSSLQEAERVLTEKRTEQLINQQARLLEEYNARVQPPDGNDFVAAPSPTNSVVGKRGQVTKAALRSALRTINRAGELSLSERATLEEIKAYALTRGGTQDQLNSYGEALQRIRSRAREPEAAPTVAFDDPVPTAFEEESKEDPFSARIDAPFAAPFVTPPVTKRSPMVPPVEKDSVRNRMEFDEDSDEPLQSPAPVFAEADEPPVRSISVALNGPRALPLAALARGPTLAASASSPPEALPEDEPFDQRVLPDSVVPVPIASQAVEQLPIPSMQMEPTFARAFQTPPRARRKEMMSDPPEQPGYTPAQENPNLDVLMPGEPSFAVVRASESRKRTPGQRPEEVEPLQYSISRMIDRQPEPLKKALRKQDDALVASQPRAFQSESSGPEAVSFAAAASAVPEAPFGALTLPTEADLEIPVDAVPTPEEYAMMPALDAIAAATPLPDSALGHSERRKNFVPRKHPNPSVR
jgi:hypothetical protein